MASVNFEKLKTPQQVKAVLRHCDKEKRIRSNHANKDIDKALTWQNTQSCGYDEACDRYDTRIAELDSVPGANLRKDRVTCFGLCIPTPEGFDGLSESDKYEWIERVSFIVFEQCGGTNNCVAMYYHADEVHAYKDAETGENRTSRPHLHFYMIPEIKGKLNGKEFSSKRNMMKLNKDIHEMSKQDFGLDFMNGTKRKSKKAVETLKEESRQKELEESLRRAKQQEEANRQLQNTLEAKIRQCDEFYGKMSEADKKRHEKAYKAFQNMKNEGRRRYGEESEIISGDEAVAAIMGK